MKNEKGFGLVEILIILAIIAAIAVGGWYVWQANNSRTVTVSPGETTETDPYKDWKSFTLQYEKFSFKYPATFSLEDESHVREAVTPGADAIFLKKPNGFALHIVTGVDGIGGACEVCHVVYSQEITFLGQKAALNYVAHDSSDKVAVVHVTKESDDWFGFGLNGKNVTSPFDGRALPMSMSMGYYDSTNSFIAKDLSFMTASEDVKEAIKVLESAKY